MNSVDMELIATCLVGYLLVGFYIRYIAQGETKKRELNNRFFFDLAKCELNTDANIAGKTSDVFSLLSTSCELV